VSETTCARGCIDARRHKDSCESEQCRGCAPRRASQGILCESCHLILVGRPAQHPRPDRPSTGQRRAHPDADAEPAADAREGRAAPVDVNPALHRGGTGIHDVRGVRGGPLGVPGRGAGARGRTVGNRRGAVRGLPTAGSSEAPDGCRPGGPTDQALAPCGAVRRADLPLGARRDPPQRLARTRWLASTSGPTHRPASSPWTRAAGCGSNCRAWSTSRAPGTTWSSCPTSWLGHTPWRRGGHRASPCTAYPAHSATG
jgi:hypothetical protein